MNGSLKTLAHRRIPRYREAAYSAIKEAILSGQIEAGEPLIEERLATALGISRTPVREALAILEHEGLLAPRGGRGLFIRSLSRDEFLELFTANEAVEPQLARRAARLATKADVDAIQRAIDDGRDAAERQDLHASLRSGRDFHRALGRAAGNASLAQFVTRNEEQADLFLLSLGNPRIFSREHMEASNREHQAILDAVRAGDPEAASRLVIYHGQSLRTRDAPLLSERPEDGREESAGETPAAALAGTM